MTTPDKDKKEIRQQVARAMELSDEHFECRSVGHAWMQVDPSFVNKSIGEPEAFYCTRCSMFRIDVVSKGYGELLYRAYIPPADYHVKTPEDGSRSFSAAGFRAARLKRAAGRNLPEITPTRGGENGG